MPVRFQVALLLILFCGVAKGQDDETTPNAEVAPLPPSRYSKEPGKKSGRKTIDERYEDCIARMVEVNNPSDDWMRQCLGLPKPTPKPKSTPAPKAKQRGKESNVKEKGQSQVHGTERNEADQKIAVELLKSRFGKLNDCLVDYQKRIAAFKLVASGDLHVMILWREGKSQALRYTKSTVNDPVFLKCIEESLATMSWSGKQPPLSVEYFLQIGNAGGNPRFQVSKPPEVQL